MQSGSRTSRAAGAGAFINSSTSSIFTRFSAASNHTTFSNPAVAAHRHVTVASTAQSVSTIKQNRLGSSDLVVSEVCMGTMTWGLQNTEEEAHQYLDYALSRGINFLDVAEMYPFPNNGAGWKPGRSEEIIGRYISNHPGIRSKIVIATKVSGFTRRSLTVANRYPGKMFETLPDARLDCQSILDACDASLKRLRTDYIDLYQIHWPDRFVPLFGPRSYLPQRERESVPIKETLLALKELLDCGKIRAYGVSNETTFGVCEYCRIADEIGMARPATIQNSFSLMDRRFESELAEACAPSNYNIGLLPWSIMAGGVLSGKYINKLTAEGDTVDDSLAKARFVKYKSVVQGRFCTPTTLGITAEYEKLAKAGGMSVATLAQAFCKSRWYIPSSIIGATTLEQLKENIDAFEVELSPDMLQRIDEIHTSNKEATVYI